jgi:hypothetical protein
MKVIIAGSRTCNDYNVLEKAIKDSKFNIDTVISGCAQGADKLGEKWAKNNDIAIMKYPADWNKYGKKAGFLRNIEMAKPSDALIILWDGKSTGSKHMIDIAKKYKLHIYVFYFK